MGLVELSAGEIGVKCSNNRIPLAKAVQRRRKRLQHELYSVGAGG